MCPPLIAAIPTIATGGSAAAAGLSGAAATAASQAAVASAFTTLGTAASVGSTLLAANAQNDMAEANARNAIQAQVVNEQQINLQESQLQEKAAQEKIDNATANRQALARADMAALNSGGILNNDAIGQSIIRQGLQADTGITQNLDRQTAQLGMDRLSNRNQAQSRINKVSTASNTATGLQIAGDVSRNYA